MKITMYMATSLNGFIARLDDGTDWLSDEGWASFSATAKDFGLVIMGRATYDIMIHDGSINELVDTKMIVVPGSAKKIEGAEAAADSAAAINIAKTLGADRALLIGGAKTNAAFMQAGLVDEVIIDMEPMALEQGIRLLDAPDGLNVKLELLEAKNLSKNLVQFQYQVTKSAASAK